VCTVLLCVLQCAQNEAHTQKSKNDVARERQGQACVAVCVAMCVVACVAACAERKTLPYKSGRKKSKEKTNVMPNVCCSVLQCVAVCCSVRGSKIRHTDESGSKRSHTKGNAKRVLQCAALLVTVCCRVFKWENHHLRVRTIKSVRDRHCQVCVASCCSVLQRVAACAYANPLT